MSPSKLRLRSRPHSYVMAWNIQQWEAAYYHALITSGLGATFAGGAGIRCSQINDTKTDVKAVYLDLDDCG